MGNLGTIGKYELLKRIAVGGMAEVFLARQTGPHGFEKMVVIKKILPHLAAQETFVRMFLDEARIAARFNHPNIAQIYELGEHGKTMFIAMEYVHGKDLKSVMRKCGQIRQRLPVEHVVRIVSQVLDGLHYAHSRVDPDGTPAGIVHRDVTPHNILVSFEGGVKLVDFGIAKARSQLSTTLPGQLKGKFAYMSPEQCISAEVDRRSDIFSVGVIIYELLTGKRLFKRELDVETVRAIADGEITPPSRIAPDIDQELEAIVMKALQRPKDKRFQNAQEMQLALEDYLAHKGLTSSSVHLSRFMSDLFQNELAVIKKALDVAKAEDLEGAVLSRQEDASLDDFLAMFFDEPASKEGNKEIDDIPDWPDWTDPSGEKKEKTQPIPSKRIQVDTPDTVEIKPEKEKGPQKKTEMMWKVEHETAPQNSRTPSGRSKSVGSGPDRGTLPTRKADLSEQPGERPPSKPPVKTGSSEEKPIEQAPPPKPPPGIQVKYKSAPVAGTSPKAATKRGIQKADVVAGPPPPPPRTGDKRRSQATEHPLPSEPPLPAGSPPPLFDQAVTTDQMVSDLQESHGGKWLLFGVAALVFGVLVVVAFGLGGKSATGIKPAFGYVKITSVPPGADIFLDGVRLPARTPTQLDKIRPGEEHTVEITLPGYPKWTKKFTITDTAKPVELKAVLSEAEAEKARMAGAPIVWGEPGKGKGNLKVTSSPKGAEIFLDGVFTGKKTPFMFKGLAAGTDHVVLLQLADKAVAYERVHLKQGEAKTVDLKLDGIPEAASSGRIKVRIHSEPQGAKVTVNGFPLSKPTPISVKLLAGGPSSISLSLDGYKTWSRKVRPVPGVDLTIKPRLSKK